MSIYCIIETLWFNDGDQFSDETITNRYFFRDYFSMKECIAKCKQRILENPNWKYSESTNIRTDKDDEFRVTRCGRSYYVIAEEINIEKYFTDCILKKIPSRF